MAKHNLAQRSMAQHVMVLHSLAQHSMAQHKMTCCAAKASFSASLAVADVSPPPKVYALLSFWLMLSLHGMGEQV